MACGVCDNVSYSSGTYKNCYIGFVNHLFFYDNANNKAGLYYELDKIITQNAQIYDFTILVMFVAYSNIHFLPNYLALSSINIPLIGCMEIFCT